MTWDYMSVATRGNIPGLRWKLHMTWECMSIAIGGNIPEVFRTSWDFTGNYDLGLHEYSYIPEGTFREVLGTSHDFT